MQKIYFLLFAVLFALILGLPNAQEASTSFTVTEEDKLISQVVVKLIEQYHYSTPTLDDTVSQKLFDEYLRRLDPNRYFFLETDIRSLAKYQDTLDDMIRRGDIGFAFIVYETYRKRVSERVDYIQKILQEPTNFDSDETMVLDRKNSPWAKNVEELNDIWRKEIKNQLLQNKLAEILDAEEAKAKAKKEEKTEVAVPKMDPKERILKRYQRYQRFLQDHDKYDAMEYFLSSFTEVFDPHSSYMNWRTVQDFDIALKLSLQGIGALLSSEDGYPKIEQIVPGGAAEKQGQLKPGYRVIAVGQGNEPPENVIDMPLNKVVRKIRGAKGTQVTLTVIKDLQSVPFNIVITRDDIKLVDRGAKGEVKEVLMADGKKVKLGIVSIPSFYRDFEGIRRHEASAKSSVQDVKNIVDGMLEKDKIAGLIIDLRSNPGGSLEEAVDLAGLFIPKGPVVQIRTMIENQVREDEDNGFAYSMPLVVMINTFSASASEIFAGVIQDYDRGVIVGQNSYGKGTVQNLLDLQKLSKLQNLKAGALKYTTAKFYRVNGGSTQKKGIIPDILYPSFTKAEEYGEASLKNAMAWDEIDALSFRKSDQEVSAYIPFLKDNHKKRIDKDPQFQELSAYIQWWQERKNRKEITLNFDKRLKIAHEEEAWSKKLEKILEDNKNLEDDETTSEDTKKDSGKDIYLEESIHILQDLTAVGKK